MVSWLFRVTLPVAPPPDFEQVPGSTVIFELRERVVGWSAASRCRCWYRCKAEYEQLHAMHVANHLAGAVGA